MDAFNRFKNNPDAAALVAKMTTAMLEAIEVDKTVTWDMALFAAAIACRGIGEVALSHGAISDAEKMRDTLLLIFKAGIHVPIMIAHDADIEHGEVRFQHSHATH